MPAVGMGGDTATETSRVAAVDRCDGRALIKHRLIILLFRSTSCGEKHMPESHKQTIDFLK